MGNIKEYKLKLKQKQTNAYNENKYLIMLVYLVGNKIALQKQIEEILLHYNIYPDAQSIYRAVDRLHDAGLVDKKKYEDMNVIVLRNPAIKWIAEEMNTHENKVLFNSQSLGKKLTDEAVYTSLFKMEYYINHMKSPQSTKNLELDLYNLLKNNSLVYRKDKGYEMLYSFVVKNVKDRQYREFTKYVKELKKHKEIKAKSVPDREGKNKEYIENKRESFKNGASNIDVKKKKKKSDSYNMNSILNTKNLVLKLDEHKIYQNKVSSVATVTESELHFKLYVMDINNSMNYRTLADMSRKTYVMLREVFGRMTVNVSKNQKCSNCPYYEKNKELLIELRKKQPGAKACYPGTEHQRFTCNATFEYLQRDIYLEVIYIGWNQEKANSMEFECNKIGYDETGLRDYPNFKYRVLNDRLQIDSSDFDNYISLSFESYNIDRFGEHKGSQNLEEYNRAKRQNALVKEELKENDELVQILKALNSKIKDSGLTVEDFINSL